MTTALDFDEPSHTYRLDGQVVPGITSVLRRAGLVDADWFNEAARARGSAVHLATQYQDEGDLDESSLAPSLRGYLVAWCAFKADVGWLHHKEPEFLVASPSLRYATRIDRVGQGQGNRIAILNVKTSVALYPWVAVQLAGEALAYAEWLGVPLHRLDRFSLRLRSDGTYQLDPHKDRHDYDVFRAARTVAAWKESHGNRE